MKTLLDNINEHERNQNERTKLYADYYEPKVDESVATAQEVFRGNLLKHLAGNIVVKEHRIRYQKEQFDRFLASTKYGTLQSNSQTLKEFAHNYAALIASMTDSSHHFKCPKIEANYDDFAKESILPLSPTIFYYYFSANRSGRTWAQWMLAAVRYPNSKTRRAYMRFFS